MHRLKVLPKFVLSGYELDKKSAELSKMIVDVLNEKFEDRNIPVIIEAKLNKDAQAKSHRKKIENIFFTNKNNVIGITYENTLIIRVDSQKEGSEIRKKICDVKNNAYGISGIDNIVKYKPNVYKVEKDSNYKVKLFNFNDFSINASNKEKFEEFLKDEGVEFERTKYTNYVIYRILK